MTFEIGNNKPFIVKNLQTKDDLTLQNTYETDTLLQAPSILKLSNKFNELFKVVKEETVTNEDGTTTVVKTFADGGTLKITNKKDENGQEFEEKIQTRADGTVQAETKTYPGKTSETKFYDKDGNLEFSNFETYAEDGKTIKTKDFISYSGKDANGNPKIAQERHTYENGTEASVRYNDDGKPEVATIETKNGDNTVKYNFDLKGQNITPGSIKLDDKGWIATDDGKFPKLTSKTVINEELSTEITSKYTYNDDGTITEECFSEDGKTYYNYYDNIDDLRNGLDRLLKMAKNWRY